MDEMKCGNCENISVPRVYLSEDRKHAAWECREDLGGCGIISHPDSWWEAEDEEMEDADDEEEDSNANP